MPSLLEIQNLCHQTSKDAGWWDDLEFIRNMSHNTYQRLFPYIISTKICLSHSELSEGLEGFRKSLLDSHLPARTSLEVELADTLIRIFDIAGLFHFNMEEIILEKLEYNKTREDHKLENRVQLGGKSF